MSLTVWNPESIDVYGHVQVNIGAGFASVAAPKLTEVPTQITCSLADTPNGSTDIKTKSKQRLCDLNARESIDTRTMKMPDTTFYGDGSASETAFLAMVAQDKTVSMFIRPYLLSSAALAVGDKGDAYNLKVGALDRVGSGGDQWAYRVQWVDASRSALNVALTA